MRETMNDAPGVGLAAPQVGVPLQLAVIEDKQEYMSGLTPEHIAERERQPVPFHVIINPVLHVVSGADVEFFEGCLSVPGFTAIVPRARQVRVECLDQTGAPRSIEASGWYARILQHEIDHLTGRFTLTGCWRGRSARSTTMFDSGRTRRRRRSKPRYHSVSSIARSATRLVLGFAMLTSSC